MRKYFGRTFGGDGKEREGTSGVVETFCGFIVVRDG